MKENRVTNGPMRKSWLMKQSTQPNGKCVEISTQSAIKEMVAPEWLQFSLPWQSDSEEATMLGGLLAGVTASGFYLPCFVNAN